MRFARVAAMAGILVVSCAPTASGPPTPTASTATSPVPTAPPALKRIQVAETPYPAVAGPFVVFQMPGETRLRAVPFTGEVNGRLEGGGAGQVSESAGWSQSPYGAPYLVGTTVYDRDGKSLGAIPWTTKASKTWSSDGRFLCVAVPTTPTAGAQMRLETALIGQPAKVVATGYTTYSDNAVYRVLACDQGTDRAVVASFGQGVTPANLWVIRLSTGAIVRAVDYAGVIGWVAASPDGSMLAESSPPAGGATNWKTTIRSADDGRTMATLDDLVARGFSADKTLVVGNTPSAAAIVDWKTGRKVWSASGPYGGYLPEPAGRRIAVGVGFVSGSDQRDVYLVAPDGSASLLSERVRVALLY